MNLFNLKTEIDKQSTPKTLKTIETCSGTNTLIDNSMRELHVITCYNNVLHSSNIRLQTESDQQS